MQDTTFCCLRSDFRRRTIDIVKFDLKATAKG